MSDSLSNCKSEAELAVSQILRKWIIGFIVSATSLIGLFVNMSVQLATIETRMNDIASSLVDHIQEPAHVGQAIAQAENVLRMNQLVATDQRIEAQYERILQRLETIQSEIEEILRNR